MSQQGLPGEFLLLFVLLIWLLFILTFLSDTHNKLNFWCFFSGMIFSLGVFKEYLYFILKPYLNAQYPGIITEEFSLIIYSVMTALLYYFAMPCVLIFSFYFSGLNQKNPRLFKVLCLLIFIPAVIFGIIFPYTQTRHFQTTSRTYYILVAVYNWVYGIIGTSMIIRPLITERLTFQYRQRKMVSVNVLLPIWYWLFTAFAAPIIHFPSNSKLWQGNILIIFILLIYYLRNVFKEGIWGTRLTRQTYDWFGNSKIIQKNAQYLSHTLKNELAKITWCTGILKKSDDVQRRELDIIDNSVEHLLQFVNKTRIYSADIVLKPDFFNVSELFQECIDNLSLSKEAKNIRFHWKADSLPLYGDREHLREVLNNLLMNGYEAVSKDGLIDMDYKTYPKKHTAVIQISDNGCGISEEELLYIFDPYFTKKSSSAHLGLGLYYCYNVMDKHHGSIRVKSTPDKGTSFFLYFPIKRTKNVHKL